MVYLSIIMCQQHGRKGRISVKLYSGESLILCFNTMKFARYRDLSVPNLVSDLFRWRSGMRTFNGQTRWLDILDIILAEIPFGSIDKAYVIPFKCL